MIPLIADSFDADLQRYFSDDPGLDGHPPSLEQFWLKDGETIQRAGWEIGQALDPGDETEFVVGC